MCKPYSINGIGYLIFEFIYKLIKLIKLIEISVFLANFCGNTQCFKIFAFF